jgi:hypothetical protein
MYLEVLGFWGLLCLAGFVVSEWKGRNVTIGIISAVLLVLLGAWLLAEPVEIKTGENTLATQSYFMNVSTPNSSYIPQSGNSVQTNVYSSVSATFFIFNQALGAVFVLIGLWAGYKYAFAMKQGW